MELIQRVQRVQRVQMLQLVRLILAVETIDGNGQSTLPPQAGGFAFPIPFDGVVFNLQVSCDAFATTAASINTIGLKYVFTVFKESSSNNSGIDQPATGYITTALSSTLTFGYPNTTVTATTYRTATNLNSSTILNVSAGDRIGIRIQTDATTDASAAEVTSLSFSASLSYKPN